MPFFELTVQVSQQLAEPIDELLQVAGAVGVTYVDAKDHPIYEPAPGEMPLWQDIKLIGLFDQQALMEQASEQLAAAMRHVANRLLKQQTLLGHCKVQSPSGVLFQQAVVITFRVIPKQ